MQSSRAGYSFFSFFSQSVYAAYGVAACRSPMMSVLVSFASTALNVANALSLRASSRSLAYFSRPGHSSTGANAKQPPMGALPQNNPPIRALHTPVAQSLASLHMRSSEHSAQLEAPQSISV